MRRRDKASGKAVKPRRQKTSTHRNAPKTVRRTGAVSADLQDQLDRLTRELKDALEQQTATSEVLQVISSSSGELAPVFEFLLASAKHLCGADFGIILLREGDAFRTVALHGATAEYTEARWHAPFIRPAADTGLGRVLETKQVVQIADVRAVPGYVDNPAQAPIVQLAGVRSKLCVPMLKEDYLIGVVEIDRQEIRPFTERQIELVQNFAAQAVIAIENARLLYELRESLQQQTATSEVLKVISRSLSDTQPAFDAIVRAGLKLFPGAAVSIELPRDGEIAAAAIAAEDAAGVENWRRIFPFPLTREYMAGVAILDRRIVDVADASETGDAISVGRRNFLRSGYRAVTKVPMMRGDHAIGVLSVARPAPGPLTERQLTILTTFADQAVIAIENVRLLNELRQSTQDLTENSAALAALSSKLAKYLAPQVYNSIFTGQQDVKIVSKRKKLTVCFSDLVGFTEITDNMESEDLTQLLNHYLTEMSKIAQQYGATIDKYVGDAIVMFFGDPTTLGVKQDALACVQMAIAMQQRVGELAQEWLSSGIATPLRCRIGIHTGYCTVGNFGSEDRMDYTMVGGTVNLASRLEHEAPPGGVLISFETYAHVKDKVRCEERGPVQVKGIAQPVATYAVLGPKQDADRGATAHLRLELDAERMTGDERKAAAHALRRALGLLKKAAKPND